MNSGLLNYVTSILTFHSFIRYVYVYLYAWQLCEQIIGQDSRLGDLHHTHNYSCLNNPLTAALQ